MLPPQVTRACTALQAVSRLAGVARLLRVQLFGRFGLLIVHVSNVSYIASVHVLAVCTAISIFGSMYSGNSVDTGTLA